MEQEELFKYQQCKEYKWCRTDDHQPGLQPAKEGDHSGQRAYRHP